MADSNVKEPAADKEQASGSYIYFDFTALESVRCRIQVSKCSVMQIWAAARWLERYADDMRMGEVMRENPAMLEVVRGLPNMPPPPLLRRS